jgi:hypothetical protein
MQILLLALKLLLVALLYCCLGIEAIVSDVTAIALLLVVAWGREGERLW